jgi:hypothetical protein
MLNRSERLSRIVDALRQWHRRTSRIRDQLIHCPLPIDFAQDHINLIEFRIDIMKTPSMSNISPAIVPTPNRPNQRLKIGQFEAVSSGVVLETVTIYRPTNRSKWFVPTCQLERFTRSGAGSSG